jgi:hypothetical protein
MLHTGYLRGKVTATCAVRNEALRLFVKAACQLNLLLRTYNCKWRDVQPRSQTFPDHNSSPSTGLVLVNLLKLLLAFR